MMEIEQLDITPNMKGIKYEERQFHMEKFPIIIHTSSDNELALNIVKIHTSTYPAFKGPSLQQHTSLVLDLEDCEKFIELLRAATEYLKNRTMI